MPFLWIIRIITKEMEMARMFNPPHPAETLREDVLPALGLSVAEAARQLGISRVQLSRVINQRSGISADLALRLEAWLATPEGGPSAESWLRGQAAYDLWQAAKDKRPKVSRAVAHRA
jgi:addiction module HigA family antidote